MAKIAIKILMMHFLLGVCASTSFSESALKDDESHDYGSLYDVISWGAPSNNVKAGLIPCPIYDGTSKTEKRGCLLYLGTTSTNDVRGLFVPDEQHRYTLTLKDQQGNAVGMTKMGQRL